MRLKEGIESDTIYKATATTHGVSSISIWIFDAADAQEITCTVTSSEPIE